MGRTGDLVLGLLDQGMSPAVVVADVLRPVQLDVGLRWQQGLLSIGDEHRASATVDNALNVLADVAHDEGNRRLGRLAVVCARGEWHTLPARMAAVACDWQGWDVTFLGAQAAAGPLLRDRLVRGRVDAVLVSLTLTPFLPGAVALCATAEELGVPAVVGGAGFGPDASAAAALGLRWAGEVSQLTTALARPAPPVDATQLARRTAEARLLRACRDGALAAAGGGSLPDAKVQDLGYLVDTLVAATLTGEARLGVAFAHWLRDMSAARGVGPGLPVQALECLVRRLPPEAGLARSVCAAARAALEGVLGDGCGDGGSDP